jgi:hypothetical protein
LKLTTGLNTVVTEALRARLTAPRGLTSTASQARLKDLPIAPTRKILCAAALAMSAIGATGASATTAAELHQFSLRQGENLMQFGG